MVEIYTDRLYLRNLTIDDAQAVYEVSKCEDVGKNAGWKPHENIEETREILKAVFLPLPYSFAIFEKQTNTLIGTGGLMSDPKREYDKAMMLGYSLGKDYWGKGYMTEAAKGIIKYAFEEIGLELVSAYCYHYNERSKRVIEKCGMMYEGNLQKCELRYDNVLLDNECYSISRAEYFEHTIL